MGRMILLYDNAADEGTLSGGSWSQPLAAMQDPRTTRRARSSNLTAASTTFQIELNDIETFKAIAFGPTNFTSSAQYRLRGYSDSDYSIEVYDSGVVGIGAQAENSLDLLWEDPNFWTGVQPIEDPDNSGFTVIHIFDEPTTAKYWLFEIDDAANPDGYIEIGRLYMGMAWQPSLNYLGNTFGWKPNTTVQQSLGGSRYYNRRKALRFLRLSIPSLPLAEVMADVYRIQTISGLDKQVFIIPDPDDVLNRNKRSFLGNLTEPSAIEQLKVGRAATAFDITEAV